MQKNEIEKLVEHTMNSFDGAARAEAKPFLLTRIFARIKNEKDPSNIWTRAASFLSTPGVALGGLLLIIVLNITIIMQKQDSSTASLQNINSTKDEFAINVISIYDVENQEP